MTPSTSSTRSLTLRSPGGPHTSTGSNSTRSPAAALVVLAEHLPQRRPNILRQAERLLHAGAHSSPNDPPQRSALRHGAWLSLAHYPTGDLDLAVTTARLALSRLPAVSSARSVALPRRVHDDLAVSGARSPELRNLLSELRTLPELAGLRQR